MGIRFKLLSGFGVVLLLLLLLSGTSYTQLENVEQTFTNFIDKELQLTEEAKNVQVSFAVTEAALNNYVLFGDQQHLDKLMALDGQTDDSIKKVKKLAQHDQTRQLATQIEQSMDAYDQYTEEIVSLVQSGKLEEARMYIHSNQQVLEKFHQAVEQLAQYQAKEEQEAKSSVEKKVDSVNCFVILLTLVTLLAGVLLALFMGRLIAHPLQQMAQEAAKIASGDLSGRDLPVKNRDELSTLARSFNQMRANLRALAGHLIHTADSLTTAAAGLSQQTQHTTTAASRNAATISEISASADQIAHNTHQVATVAQETASTAEAGQQGMAGITQQIEVIATSGQHASQMLQKLVQELSQVNQIVELITHIADQTNMLALNAAIESARAGEQGRGFAVVAEEVRKLAEQSAAAAGKIRTHIEQIHTDSGTAVASMDTGTANIKNGAEVIHEVSGRFSSLLQTIGGLSGQVQQLSAAVQQISAGVQNVAATTEDQTAALQEVSSATEELTRLADALKAAANGFKI